MSQNPREGDLVLARFPQDDQVYRAKVTGVRKTSYEVLYIDYGNSCQDLGQDDLWLWEPLYEMIQPQAHLCSFNFPKIRNIKPEVFQKVMISQGAMKMQIFQVSPSQGLFKASQRDFGKKTELWVSLTTAADKDVCEVLASHCAILGQLQPQSPSPRRSPNPLESLDAPPAKFVSAPPPLHLQAEQGGLALSPPPSPIPPQMTVMSVQKVFDWDCSLASQVSYDDQDSGLEGKVGRSLKAELLYLRKCFVQVAQQEDGDSRS